MSSLVTAYTSTSGVLEKKILNAEQKVIGIKNVEVLYIRTTLDIETIKTLPLEELKVALLELIPAHVRDIQAEITPESQA